MSEIDFITRVHQSTKRDYIGRVVGADKAACAEVAGRFGAEYWDGERQFGYGGYHYDGRWHDVAAAIIRHYDLTPTMRILDVGCGKGFLLYEFTKLLPGVKVQGIDISAYGIANAKEEVRPFLDHGSATALPYDDKRFDFVVSLNTLHNLYNYDLHAALGEINRVARGAQYITVESYRNEHEKVNLLYWQLTCRAFMTPAEWEWTFAQAGYKGDYGFIYFE
jgi:protein-L-isoaspartate(D-aspartate) O-methyltransferase